MKYVDTEDPEQRSQEMHRYYSIFLPAQKKYGLTAACHTSLFDDSSIRIWQGEGKEKRLIIRVENASETRCYTVAADELQRWIRKKKEQSVEMPRVC